MKISFHDVGRLALRAAFGAVDSLLNASRAGKRVQVAHLNKIKGKSESTAHLAPFDTVQSPLRGGMATDGAARIRINGPQSGFNLHATAADIPWGELGADVLLECTSKCLTSETLQSSLDLGGKACTRSCPGEIWRGCCSHCWTRLPFWGCAG